jgi:glycosyltransferase involved in cell wall biosynthesis
MLQLSVIVPVYNTEKYLGRCIDSILVQTYKDYEIILVNDGSIDGSGKLCDEYASKNKRIKVIHKNNGGSSSARNAGLRYAEGKYITFVDSDDWIEQDMYQKLMGCIQQKTDIDICIGSYVLDKNDKVEAVFAQHNEERSFLSKSALLAMFEQTLFNWTLWDKIYRRDLFYDDKICDDSIEYGDDTVANWILFKRAEKIYYKPVYGYHYCMRDDSLMQQKFNVKKLVYLDILKKIYNETIDDLSSLRKHIANIAFSYTCLYIYQMLQEQTNYEENVKDYQKDLEIYKKNMDRSLSASEERKYVVAILPYKKATTYVMQKNNELKENIKLFCEKYEKIYIYGAGIIAGQIADVLEQENIRYEGFVISDTRGNQKSYHNKKVMVLADLKRLNKWNNIGILFAINEKNFMHVIEEVKDEFCCFNAGKFTINY